MKIRILQFVFVFSIPLFLNAQIDSLRQQLLLAKTDSLKITLYLYIAGTYQFTNPDSAIHYAKNGFVLAKELGRPAEECNALRVMALAMRSYGNDPIALQIKLKALKLAEKHDLKFDQALSLGQIGEIYAAAGDYEKALNNLYQSQKVIKEVVGVRPSFLLLAQNRIATTYVLMGQRDSAEHHLSISLEIAEKLTGAETWSVSRLYVTLGDFEKAKGNLDRSKSHYLSAIELGTGNQITPHFRLAQLYQQIDKPDSSIFHANRCIALLSTGSLYHDIAEAYGLLSTVYENLDQQKAYFYSKLARTYQDSLFEISRSVALERFIDFDQEERQNELNVAEAEFDNRIRTNALLGSSFTLIVIALLLYRNNRVQKKSKRNTELAYERLKNTQSQLIQSEKMASLGELTAGIAHEIQNPLNFVNNFSEVNKELIKDLKSEIENGNLDEVKAIAKDIESNEEKIVHHGKRADGIVKSMLQHSRSRSGEKEPTDINALCDEYLRLAYHGMRAKNKSFNAKFETHFDETVEKIEVVPQDIGRVILNLITNAFYAVTEKRKTESGKYEPTVKVGTKKVDGNVMISVTDNGNGIPKPIKEKIFQPFFTTKPTGQGTGLGLSLAYDIVKAHGGELKVETREGEGSEFSIQLPIV